MARAAGETYAGSAGAWAGAPVPLDAIVAVVTAFFPFRFPNSFPNFFGGIVFRVLQCVVTCVLRVCGSGAGQHHLSLPPFLLLRRTLGGQGVFECCVCKIEEVLKGSFAEDHLWVVMFTVTQC